MKCTSECGNGPGGDLVVDDDVVQTTGDTGRAIDDRRQNGAITDTLPNFIPRDVGHQRGGKTLFIPSTRLSRSSASRITHLIIKLIWPFCMAVGKRF